MPKEKYIEVCEGGITHRGNVIPINKFKHVRRDYACYTSMFCFSTDIVEHFNNQKEANQKPSVKGYTGTCAMTMLWIDVDCKNESVNTKENVMQTIVQVKNIVGNLMSKYDMKEKHIAIYFSGNKGFHIGIPAEAFGAETYFSETVPAICKLLAAELTDNNEFVDYPIYEPVRIFRTPTSKHEKTGLYKIVVSWEAIERCAVDEIIEKASMCQNYKAPFSRERNQLLKRLWEKYIGKAAEKFEIMPTNSPTIAPNESITSIATNNTLFRIPKPSERNNHLFKQAIRLFSTDLKNNECVDIIKMIADVCNNYATVNNIAMLSEFEIRTLINQAFKYQRGRQAAKVKVQDVASLAHDVFYAVQNAKFISTRINDFNVDMRGGCTLGNLYSVIGMGGTMKSLWTQDIAVESAYQDILGIYNNGEMANTEFFNRLCKKALMIDFVDLIQRGQIDKQGVDQIMFNLNVKLKNRLVVLSMTNMKVEDMKDAIKQLEDERGEKCYYDVIDSLSGMYMINGNEYESNMATTKNLKEMSVDMNVATFTINHVTGGCDKVERDTSRFVRGGPKVIDNGDAYFCLSLIQDKTKMPQKMYVPGMIYVRFVNKRGSGNTIDKVVYLDENFSVQHFESDKQDFNVMGMNF